MTAGPSRRHDDTTANPGADEVERFFESLPKVVKRLRRGRWQNLVIAVFTLVAFLTVSHAQENAAERDRRDAYVQCRLVNDNAARLNDLVNTLVMRIEQADLPPAEKARAVDQYRAVLQTLPVCRKP